MCIGAKKCVKIYPHFQIEPYLSLKNKKKLLSNGPSKKQEVIWQSIILLKQGKTKQIARPGNWRLNQFNNYLCAEENYVFNEDNVEYLTTAEEGYRKLLLDAEK